MRERRSFVTARRWLRLGQIDRTATATSSDRSFADVLIDFESLGHGCEFGMVQRTCGAEPLGLFRFAGSKISNLIRVLETELDGFLTAEDVALEVRDDQEFMTFSRSYSDFYSHTQSFIHSHDEATVLASETRRVAYLKSRFLDDWRDAKRIYVHSACEDEAMILELLAALRKRSDCVLLWVVRAEHPEQRGHVERLTANLLKGYIGHYGTFAWGPRLDLPGWAMVCRAAHAIVKGRREVATVAPLAATFRWTKGANGIVHVDGADGRCRIVKTTPFHLPAAQTTVTSDAEKNELVVFSMWVLLTQSFVGRGLLLESSDVKSVNFRRADPHLLSEWQQVWLVMQTTTAGQPLAIQLTVEAEAGSEIRFCGWQIERGGIANEERKPREATIRHTVPEPSSASWRGDRLASVAASVFRRISHRRPFADAKKDNSKLDRLVFDLLREADTRMHAGLFDEAEVILTAAKTLDPWKAELFSHHALCSEMRGDPREAEIRWAEMVRIFPHIAVGHYRLAAVMRRTGEALRAVDIIERALPDHGKDVAMLVEAARVFHAARRRKDSLACWDAVIAMDATRNEWLAERSLAENAAWPYLIVAADNRVEDGR